MQEPQRVLGAVVDVGVPTNTRHRKQVDLRTHNGTRNR
jgi:hypothetical protein